VTNFAALTGNLSLGAASDRLIAESGSSVTGTVSGGGGVLELAGGSGSITGVAGTATIAGAPP